MKELDHEDLDILYSSEFIKFHSFICMTAYPDDPKIYYGYQLCTLEKKPYKDSDTPWKKWLLSFLPSRFVKTPLKYVFMVLREDRHYWAYIDDCDSQLAYPPQLSFEEVFNDVPDDTKEFLIYHMNIFR